MSQIDILKNIGKDKLIEIVSKSKSFSDVLKNVGANFRNNENMSLLKEKINNFSIDTSHFNPYDRVYQKQDELREAVKSSISIAEVLRKLDLRSTGGNHKTVKKWIKKLKLDSSHFLGQRQTTFNKKQPKPLADILVENSNYNSRDLKKRLVQENIMENKCFKCGLGDIWSGEVIVLQLDHINGDHSDNRLDNLRILCPNCHSQTKTWGRKRDKKYNKCPLCGNLINKDSTHCKGCIYKSDQMMAYLKTQRKVKNRPTKEQLLKEIAESNYVIVGKKYGVTDNAIRKWLK